MRPALASRLPNSPEVLAALAALVLVSGAGAAVGTQRPVIAVGFAFLPIALLLLGVLSGTARSAVPFIALALGASSQLTPELPLGLPFNIWVHDLLIFGALVGFFVDWALAPADERPRLPRTPVLGVALALLTVAIMIGAWRGHERYGATLVGMPLRFVGYAAIAAAMTALTPAKALRNLTIALYVGIAYQTLSALYHIGTGTSATDQLKLSTGGMRYVGVTAASFMASGFLLAALNLATRRKNELLHLVMALLAGFVLIVAFTRTVYLGLFPVLLVVFLLYPRLRSAAWRAIPLVLPVVLLGVLLVTQVAPTLIPTLVDRLSNTSAADSSVQWRANAYRTVLSGTTEEPVLGIGFGRVTEFTLNGAPNVITGDPHNGYIYLFAGGGLLAVGALALLVALFLADTLWRWRGADVDGRVILTWSLGTWIVFMVHSAAEPMFTLPHMILGIWICMLLPAVVPIPSREAGLPRRRGRRAAGLTAPQPAARRA
ncbi:MAG: O-antigen ligase family protein [Actinomycetota bacterium]|nr:O-antigen ligase family protein [Actinomycetota bacterium]